MTKKGYCAVCMYVVRQLQVHLNLANCAFGGGSYDRVNDFALHK